MNIEKLKQKTQDRAEEYSLKAQAKAKELSNNAKGMADHVEGRAEEYELKAKAKAKELSNDAREKLSKLGH